GLCGYCRATVEQSEAIISNSPKPGDRTARKNMRKIMRKKLRTKAYSGHSRRFFGVDLSTTYYNMTTTNN
ncbi:MAG: hypothetical protein LBH42_05565, partial [Treponema sp.]|nr:hypothetical protein [Treponema sp.]